MLKPEEIRNRKLLKTLIVVGSILFLGVITYGIGWPMLRMVDDPDRFRAWVDSHGLWSDLAFIGMMVIQTVIALIPGEPFEIAAGYAFGIWEGTALCIISTVIGSAIIFWLMHRFGMKVALLFFSQEKLESLPLFKKEKKTKAVLLFLMILPGTPKDLISYAAGLTNIPFWPWMGIVAVSRIPSAITSIIGGDALGSKQYVLMIIVFAVTLAVSGLGWLIYHLYCKHSKHRKSDKE